MPIYEYRCACGRAWETVRRIAERDTAVCACGRAPQRMLSRLAAVAPDLTPYYDDGLGRRIESRSHRRRVMQAVSAIEAGDRSGRPLHGARGTVFSFPGQTTTSVPKSGAYASA